MGFLRLLEEKPFVLLDGAMGTMLQRAGLEAGQAPDLLNLTHPDMVTDIHRAYIASGADILYSNTFGANRCKLSATGRSVAEVTAAGIAAARRAADGSGALVALDMGPTGEMMAPYGTMSFEDMTAVFREQVEAGMAAGADLAVVETMTDLNEARAAVLAVREAGDLPVIGTMTFDEHGRTFTGCDVKSMALTMEGLGVTALGINCSLGPDQLEPLVRQLAAWSSLPLVVKANAGLPDAVGNYPVDPPHFAACAAALAPYGVRIVGGCCGTTPETVAALKTALAPLTPVRSRPLPPAAVCNANRVVSLDAVRVVGERINPTGRQALAASLADGEVDEAVELAADQIDAGVSLLDVNVGAPGVDEAAMMAACAAELQGMAYVPLVLDSVNPAALEAGLRQYAGRALVNSVSGEARSLEALLPLVKKYGAMAVGMTLDDDGIPPTSEGRLAVADKIIEAAQAHGIDRGRIIIDCLALPQAADSGAADVTLRALRLVKEHLGVKTVLGISNVSHGLPQREAVNGEFLRRALEAGLDLPILNPTAAMMNIVNVYAGR